MITTLSSYLAKVRTWGLVGIWNYCVGKVEKRRLRRFFLKNAARHPCTPSDEGLTLVAPFHATYSLGKVMRDLAFRLKEAGIPFQAFDTSREKCNADAEIDALITPIDDFQILKYRHVVELLLGPVPTVDLGLEKAHVAFWEFDSGMTETFPALASPDTVIAMSDFNETYFRKCLPSSTPVAKLLYPFRFKVPDIPSGQEIRKRFGIGKDDFAVFFNFDYGSSFFRKNPDGAMRAFAKAFPNTAHTRLVFKTNRSSEYPRQHESLQTLARALGISDRFTFIDGYLSSQDIYGLTAACDVYLSLHRGEGFGLCVAEAMSFGKPVIVSDYASTSEFCNSDNAFIIPVTRIPYPDSQRDHPYYLTVAECAEPDIDAAAAALKRCYDDPAYRTAIGLKGKAFVEEHFSTANFKRSVEAFLNG